MEGRAVKQAKTLLALHVLLMAYSLLGVLSKFAAVHPFLSPRFCLCYSGIIAILGVYALGWQQIIKRMPLTTAFANKAVTVVWGLVLGTLIFHEPITQGKIVGGLLIMAGVVLFSTGKQEETDP